MPPLSPQTCAAPSCARAGPCASPAAPLQRQRQLLPRLQGRGPDSFLAQVAREIRGEAVHRVHLAGARSLAHLHDLVALTVVSQLQRTVPADSSRQLPLPAPPP